MNPDLAAAGRGGAAALALLVPGVVLGELAGPGSLLRSLSLVVVLAGFALGGAAAGRAAAHDRLPSGALAAGGAYLVVQAVGVVLRLARGESVSWIGFPLLFLLAASIGMVGAWAGTRRPDGEPGGDVDGRRP